MKLAELQSELKQHMAEELRAREDISEKLDKILENHLSHMEIDLAVLKERTDVVWSAGKIMLGIIITSILGAVMALILR